MRIFGRQDPMEKIREPRSYDEILQEVVRERVARESLQSQEKTSTITSDKQ